jgi:hypothetical protein
LTLIGRRFFNKPNQRWSYNQAIRSPFASFGLESTLNSNDFVIDNTKPISSASNHPLGPLQFVAAAFRHYLVKKCVLTMLCPRAGSKISFDNHEQLASLDSSASTSASQTASLNEKAPNLRQTIDLLYENSIFFGDERAAWWAQVLRAGLIWMKGQTSTESVNQLRLNLPTSMRNEQLPVAILLAGQLRRFVNSGQAKHVHVLHRLMDEASSRLWSCAQRTQLSNNQTVELQDLEHETVSNENGSVSEVADEEEKSMTMDACEAQMTAAFQVMCCGYSLLDSVVIAIVWLLPPVLLPASKNPLIPAPFHKRICADSVKIWALYVGWFVRFHRHVLNFCFTKDRID